MPWHPQIGLYPSAHDEPLSLVEWQALQYRLAHHPESIGGLAGSAPNGLIAAVRLDYLRYQHAVNLTLARDPRLSLEEAEARHVDILFPPAGPQH